MRILPATAALGCALVLCAACASIHVERPVPARPATVQTVPGATIITPGTAPSYVFVR